MDMVSIFAAFAPRITHPPAQGKRPKAIRTWLLSMATLQILDIGRESRSSIWRRECAKPRTTLTLSVRRVWRQHALCESIKLFSAPCKNFSLRCNPFLLHGVGGSLDQTATCYSTTTGRAECQEKLLLTLWEGMYTYKRGLANRLFF